MSEKKKILFVCTGNSCRSQMAEAWTRHLKGDEFEPYSAGIEFREVDPRTVIVMSERGVDISQYRSKHLDSLASIEFDYVVTLCSHAQETCPFYTAKTKVLHRGFDDPPQLAQTCASEEEIMNAYRRVREEIRSFVLDFPDSLDRH